jgi:hypothetical protein
MQYECISTIVRLAGRRLEMFGFAPLTDITIGWMGSGGGFSTPLSYSQSAMEETHCSTYGRFDSDALGLASHSEHECAFDAGCLESWRFAPRASSRVKLRHCFEVYKRPILLAIELVSACL